MTMLKKRRKKGETLVILCQIQNIVQPYTYTYTYFSRELGQRHNVTKRKTLINSTKMQCNDTL